MIIAVNAIMQLRKEARKKKSGLQWGLIPWPRDTGVMLYQLSYEVTDVGSRSIVGSYVPAYITVAIFCIEKQQTYHFRV